jgi:hypothetical protein
LNGILVKKFYIYLINITIEKPAGIRHIASKATRNPRPPVAAKQKLDRRTIGEGGSGRSAMGAALDQSDLSQAQAVRRRASSPSRGGRRSCYGLGRGEIPGGPTIGRLRRSSTRGANYFIEISTCMREMSPSSRPEGKRYG